MAEFPAQSPAERLMASTYSTLLGVELPATGDQAGSWSTTTNSNLGTILAEAIAGVASVSVTTANIDLTFTAPPLQTQNGRMAVLRLTGASTGARTLSVNASSKTFIVDNATTGGYDHIIQVTGGGGTSVTIPNGKSLQVYSNGTNFYAGVTYVSGYALLSGATFTGNVALASNGLTVGTTQLAVSGGNTSVGGNLAVTGTSVFTGGVTASTTLAVTGATTLNGAVTLGDNSADAITITGTPTFGAAATFSSTAAFTGAATFNGDVTLGNASGDTITVTGTATFGQYGTFSTGVQVVASVSTAPALRCSTDTNTGIYFSGSDAMGFTTGGTSKVHIDSSGNLGVGTQSPAYKLQVVGDLCIRPGVGTTVTPNSNADLVVETTNNTTLTFKLRGSDGVTRTGTLTLA